jgi:hypothetical protein
MNGPETRVVAETKDGRRFFLWIWFYEGRQTLEQSVSYRTRTLTARFDYANIVTDSALCYPLFRQRRGRSQPNMAVTPHDWMPIDGVLWTLNAVSPLFGFLTRPRPDIFTSDALIYLLK